MLTLLLAASLMLPPLERPHLTIAQGLVESNLNPKAKGKTGERGAWQVIPKQWGKVPKKLGQQAVQAEKILNELLAENDNDMFESLVKYNSFKNKEKGKAYARKVRKRAIEICLLDVL